MRENQPMRPTAQRIAQEFFFIWGDAETAELFVNMERNMEKISAKTKLYWLSTFDKWAEDRLSPPQYYEAHSVLVEVGLFVNDDENVDDLIDGLHPEHEPACNCPCHEHPGTYPTRQNDPCHYCGHVNSDGHLAGIGLGWYRSKYCVIQ